MTDYRERFLAAEDHADKLVGQLQALKTKMESHSSATAALEDVHKSLVNFISEVNNMTIEIRGVTQKLGEIGTSEILHSINSVEEKVSGILPYIERGSRRLERLSWVILVLQAILAIMAVIIMAKIL